MDATKKMYIDSILHRGALYPGSSDLYWEMVEGEDGAELQISKEELQRRRAEKERKYKEQQDKTYFQKLREVVEVYMDPKHLEQI